MSLTPVIILFVAVCQVVRAQYYPPYPYYPYQMPYMPPLPQFPPYPYPSTGKLPPIDPYQQYPYQTYPQYPRIIPIPSKKQTTLPNLDNIPTEIIDVDQNFVATKTPVITPDGDKYKPYIHTSESHYSSNINGNQGVHIYESKPIHTKLHKVFTTDGKGKPQMVNIHLVNGVEITSEEPSSTSTAPSIATERIQATTAQEESNEDDPPKPISTWLFG